MKIEFTTDNAAFYGFNGEEDVYARNDEIKRVLLRISEDIDYGKTFGSCIDINGNKIGTWEI